MKSRNALASIRSGRRSGNVDAMQAQPESSDIVIEAKLSRAGNIIDGEKDAQFQRGNRGRNRDRSKIERHRFSCNASLLLEQHSRIVLDPEMQAPRGTE